MKKHFYAVGYDIEENRIRNKMAKYLKSYGFRVQKSIFEIYISHDEKKAILEYFKRIRGKNDKVAFYLLCEKCQRQRSHFPKIKRTNYDII